MILTDLSRAIRKLWEKISFHKHFKETLYVRLFYLSKQNSTFPVKALRREFSIYVSGITILSTMFCYVTPVTLLQYFLTLLYFLTVFCYVMPVTLLLSFLNLLYFLTVFCYVMPVTLLLYFLCFAMSRL